MLTQFIIKQGDESLTIHSVLALIGALLSKTESEWQLEKRSSMASGSFSIQSMNRNSSSWSWNLSIHWVYLHTAADDIYV